MPTITISKYRIFLLGAGTSFDPSKIFRGLPEKFKNIPSGQGVKITERLTNVMKDFPMPSGMKDGFRNAKDLWKKDLKGSASDALNKAQTAAVNMFESKFRFLNCICICIPGV
jgi:hypothetical protein